MYGRSTIGPSCGRRRRAVGASRRSCYSGGFPLCANGMRFFARTVLLLLFALPVLAIAAIWLCFQDAPTVVRSVQLTPQDIENAKRIIDQHNPRKAKAGGVRAVTISERELDLMLNYAASRFGGGAARVVLPPGSVLAVHRFDPAPWAARPVALSIAITKWPSGRTRLAALPIALRMSPVW